METTTRMNNHKKSLINQTNHYQNKKKERKERKKKANALIPCRFYNSKGGCWRGSRCMFLHSPSQNKAHNTDNGDENEL